MRRQFLLSRPLICRKRSLLVVNSISRLRRVVYVASLNFVNNMSTFDRLSFCMEWSCLSGVACWTPESGESGPTPLPWHARPVEVDETFLVEASPLAFKKPYKRVNKCNSSCCCIKEVHWS